MNLDYKEKVLDLEIDKLLREDIRDDKKYLEESKKFNKTNYELKNEFYNNEGYNLLRLELSLFLKEKPSIRENIKTIVRNENLKREVTKDQLRMILFEIISSKLVKKFIKKNTSSKDDLVNIIKELPDLSDYKLKNIRDYCKNNREKNKCNSNLHCLWAGNDCKLQLTVNNALDYINKLIEEMIIDKIKFKELIQEDNYFVSDIINYNTYTQRDDQQIIKTTNFNLKKIMRDLFGKESVPKIGRRNMKKDEINIEEDYPELIEFGDQLIQPIMNNSDSVLRAYVNSFYWINNPLYDTESRNLGYYSDLQSQITYLLKAQIIDFVTENYNKKEYKNSLGSYFKNNNNFFESEINKFRKSMVNSDGKVELLVLSIIYNYPIIVFDNFDSPLYYFVNGVEKEPSASKKLNLDSELVIKVKFDLEPFNNIPYQIYSIYSNEK